MYSTKGATSPNYTLNNRIVAFLAKYAPERLQSEASNSRTSQKISEEDSLTAWVNEKLKLSREMCVLFVLLGIMESGRDITDHYSLVSKEENARILQPLTHWK